MDELEEPRLIEPEQTHPATHEEDLEVIKEALAKEQEPPKLQPQIPRPQSSQIVACICAFEAEQTLKRTLESVNELVDRIIVVDGSWEGFADYPESRDRTIEIAMSHDKPTTIVKNSTGKPYKDEMAKRSLYLSPGLVKEGDWLVIIDDDEFATQGMAATRKILSGTQILHYTAVIWNKVSEGNWSRQGEHVRLIRYVPGMKYAENPWTILLPNNTTIPLKATPAPLHIAHDQLSKPQHYQAMKAKARESGHFGKVETVATSPEKRKRGRPRNPQPQPAQP